MKNRESGHIFFLGIGGIGMSAIARYYNHLGWQVYGYDKTRSPLCEVLEKEGMQIGYQDDAKWFNNILTFGLSSVIYTPAIPKSNAIWQACKTLEIPVIKRAKALGDITKTKKCLAIGGTHGKTTTSSMLAHLLSCSDLPLIVFLGGISANFESNFFFRNGESEDAICVVEADEYDRSFLHLNPHSAVITSTDADHLDIYGEREDVKEAFKSFASLVKTDGKLYATAVIEDVSSVNYGVNSSADITASEIKWGATATSFQYDGLNQTIPRLILPIPGSHNLENALAAISLALDTGMTPDEIRNGLQEFKGIKRRFEKVYEDGDLVIYDDYAHHPTEIRAILDSVKNIYPERQIFVVFQPHLFSRTKDFQQEFGEALNHADQVILLDIYPARELPIEGVTSKIIGKYIDPKKVRYGSKDQFSSWLSTELEGVLLILGAGDIDRIVRPIVLAMEGGRKG